ncbi:hypothetical protein ELI38_04240 [Rhizobium leguminosarum]|uniref:Uncharacterized protein n=1 Tax=Rhizobium leguminosarum TaxID=384 RepID=A0A7M3DQS8_RHILE|nr:hypothetical protein [Rhizobium leguminosarum]MDV4159957.1 hypothetical protein [Rhizobium leguminosarum]MDV4171085.1 hypothetical protein [Rhizobium leguminosarum]NKK03640.1 hypothetical protein [Rhizobium leguminosarum bv. viciae]NKK47272.1 hypothetical protein [Rhizobium leguminosarum bv. viciae]QIO72454.1 hypothetical protein HA459_10720 [Rhizobium leguminosarum bv. trifolii]
MAEIDAVDLQRLVRLSEEVRGRLAEISMIVARASGNTEMENAPVRKFTAKGVKSKNASTRAGDWMEIIDVDGVEACYGVINGKPFAESPCGG